MFVTFLFTGLLHWNFGGGAAPYGGKRSQVLHACQGQVVQVQAAKVLREEATEPCQSASLIIAKGRFLPTQSTTPQH